MPYADIDGARIFYERTGTGDPPLVFVHGYLCDHEDWQGQADYFGGRKCVVTCDLRSHGRSDPDFTHCDIRTLGSDIGALISALDLGPAVLIGHSMGCRVILQTYLDRPHSISGLVLIEGSRIGTGDPAVFEEMARNLIKSEGYEAMIDRNFNEMFPEGADPVLKEQIKRRARNVPEAIGASMFVDFLGWDARSMETALSRITTPLLIIQSTYMNEQYRRVPIVSEVNTPWFELVRSHVPDARIEVIKNSGHFPMIESSEVVNGVISDFIDGIAR